MPRTLGQTMESPNHTFLDSSVFFLVGIPGLEQFHLWLSLPVCCLGTATIVGNITILVIIATEPALHKPVYLFLCMLSTVDLAASFSTVPKLLAILWCGAGHISAPACLAQMFFIHAFCMMESTVLLAMAFDRYVAICHPLRYATVLTDTIIARIGVVAMVRGSILMLPCPFLIGRLSFCQSHVIPHTYCEHMAVVKLACGDTRPNRVYGLTAALLVIGVDLFCIGLSYILIARAVLRLSSHEARSKALGTCGSHVCVILISYTPALFSFFTHRFGRHVPLHIHILLANVYLLFPPALNPMVYGVKTKEIREKVVRVFQRGQGTGAKASE
uniref:Olfactory receptor n=3 Tax=Sus scrofa TaxID=9823 RepID=A0A8D0V5B5_PIG